MGRAHGRSRQSALAVLLQLLRTLSALPTLERLLPLPGAQRHAAATGAEVDQKVLAKVRALLAKAESTEFPDEAEALSAKAQELMSRYSLHHAVHEHDRGQAPAASGRRLWMDAPYPGAKVLLVQAVATANRCRTVWRADPGFVTVVGPDTELDIVELLTTSLLLQASRAMLAAGRQTTRAGTSRTRSFRQSFLVAYAARIGERLDAADTTATAAARSVPQERLLPVLAARSQATDEMVDRLFPRMASRPGVGVELGGLDGRPGRGGSSPVRRALPDRRIAPPAPVLSVPVGSLAVVALALYRKYRPAKFAEVVGQEHVTEPLRTALAAGRINHAYLFSGPRGCGKTSSARILARSLNCEQGPTPDPCGVCSSCISLAPGGPGNIDVTELDAASHGGVDDTRELRDRAFFAPAESRYRVFIVDEAHMITTQGFNALLKIVEEPPEHLVFVFATTEPDKVLTTIRSRTHHYPFRLIPPGTLRKLMERICAEESAVVAQAVYPLVIRAGGGSARDSLSVLDQLLAGAGPEGVTYERAVALLGVTDVSLIDDMVDALAAGDRAAVFETVDRTVEAGHDPRRFAADLLQRLRDLTLLQAVPEAPARGLVDAADDEIVRMIEQADRLSAGTLARYGEIVHSGLIEMRGATAPRLLLELLCARMLLPAATVAEPGLLERLERLERRNAIAAAPLPAGETVAEPPAEQGSAASRRTFARPSNRPAARTAQAARCQTGTGGRDGAPGRPDRDDGRCSPSRGGGMAGDRADRSPLGRPAGRRSRRVRGDTTAGRRADRRPGGADDPDGRAAPGHRARGPGWFAAGRPDVRRHRRDRADAAGGRLWRRPGLGAAGPEPAAGTQVPAGTRDPAVAPDAGWRLERRRRNQTAGPGPGRRRRPVGGWSSGGGGARRTGGRAAAGAESAAGMRAADPGRRRGSGRGRS